MGQSTSKSVSEEVNIGTQWFSIHTASVAWTSFFLLIIALVAFLVFLAVWACIRRCGACKACADCVPCGCISKETHDREMDFYNQTGPSPVGLPLQFQRGTGYSQPLRQPPVTRTFIKNQRDTVLPPLFPGNTYNGQFAFAPERFQDVASTIPRRIAGPATPPEVPKHAPSTATTVPRESTVHEILPGPAKPDDLSAQCRSTAAGF